MSKKHKNFTKVLKRYIITPQNDKRSRLGGEENMLMKSGLRDIVEGASEGFNIIEEFSELSPRRKVLLCDHLFVEGRQAFYNTVEILWPQASIADARRLEKFLYSLKNRSH